MSQWADSLYSAALMRKTLLVLAGLMLMANVALAAPKENAVVVFTANWCASCREIVPVAREVASQNGLSLQTVDVDNQSAPQQAENYGLGIPKSDLPQIYQVGPKGVRLLFDGRGYRYGSTNTVRASMLQNIQAGK
jgi:thiol-disulfide isomerase/thioredoxin